MLGAYREEAATAGLVGAGRTAGPQWHGAAAAGPVRPGGDRPVLSLYEREPAAQDAAAAVLERTGGLPLLVHQTARDWAHTAAERQVEQTSRQTATSRSHLRLVQAKLAADVVDLQELGTSHEQPSGGDVEDPAGTGGLPLQGPGPR